VTGKGVRIGCVRKTQGKEKKGWECSENVWREPASEKKSKRGKEGKNENKP